MKLHIENYRGIKAASFPLAGITLIGAPNATGKSAVAQAAGAVLAGAPIPIPGVLKTLAGMLVRVGASSGFAQLDCETGTARVDWPKAALKTKGTLPTVSAIAAGIESITAAEPKRRAELLIDLLDALPNLDDLKARFVRDGTSEKAAEAVWQTIEKQGWDAAHAQAKETGARLKGQWEAVSGERYGSKKAEGYVPNEWDPELASESDESLNAKLTDARDTLDGMIAVAAVDDAERERLQALAEELPTRAEFQSRRAAELNDLLTQVNAAIAERNALRDPASQQTHECPHCKGALSIAGGRIIEGTPPTEEDKASWKAAADKISTIQAEGTKARAALNEAVAAVRESEAAAKRLAELDTGNATVDQVERAREAAKLAQGRLDAFTKKTKADRLQSSIVQNALIVSALDTAGIRQDKLSDSIHGFLSESVNPLSAVAGWQNVEIAADMSIAYGGRAWPLLSESERYVVRTLLQSAIALRDDSAALVIDAADILDKVWRNGLIRLLRHMARPALVCMTMPTPAEVPNLRAAGMGESFWIRDGVLIPLEAAQQQ